MSTRSVGTPPRRDHHALGALTSSTICVGSSAERCDWELIRAPTGGAIGPCRSGSKRVDGGRNRERDPEPDGNRLDQAVERLHAGRDLRRLSSAVLGGDPIVVPDLAARGHLDQRLGEEVLELDLGCAGQRVIGGEGVTPRGSLNRWWRSTPSCSNSP